MRLDNDSIYKYIFKNTAFTSIMQDIIDKSEDYLEIIEDHSAIIVICIFIIGQIITRPIINIFAQIGIGLIISILTCAIIVLVFMLVALVIDLIDGLI